MEVTSIFDTDYVLRRIYKDHIKNDGTLKSTCFSDRYDSPSCHLERLTTTSNILRDNPGVICLAKLNVGEIRGLGLEVLYEPIPEDPSHCMIIKGPNTTMGEKIMRKKLVSIAQTCIVWTTETV